MTSPVSAYAGHDNLEVMADAVHYNQWLIELAGRHLPPSGTILDFGAGTGTLTRLLKAAGHDMVALEPDAVQAQQLEQSGIRTLRTLDGLADGTLDGVTTFNVLEHIEDDEAVLQTLFRKVRSGGQLFVYVPAFPMLYSSMDRKVGHVRRYRRAELVKRVAAAGFRIVSARHADSIGFFASLAYRFVGGDGGELNRRAIQLYDRWAFPVSRCVDVLTAGAFGKNLMVAATRP